jgi:hypothetical protein
MARCLPERFFFFRPLFLLPARVNLAELRPCVQLQALRIGFLSWMPRLTPSPQCSSVMGLRRGRPAFETSALALRYVPSISEIRTATSLSFQNSFKQIHERRARSCSDR